MRDYFFIGLSVILLVISGCTEAHAGKLGDTLRTVASAVDQLEQQKSGQNRPSDQSTSFRKLSLGFSPIPKQPLTTEAWLETFDQLLKQNANFVLHHVHMDWEAFANGIDVKNSNHRSHGYAGPTFKTRIGETRP